MAEECARGERAGWHDFARDCGPIASTLLRQYFPMLEPELETHVAGVFQQAHADNSAWFGQIKFTNEREFLMAFRGLVFSYGRAAARVPTPELSLEQVREIMTDLPMVERESLWLVIKGYEAQQIGEILSNAQSTAESVKKVADERLVKVLPAATKDAFNISAWVLMSEAEKAGGENCLSLKTFNNLLNGQVTWRERDVAEQHIRDCFYCLERNTSFLEMFWMGRKRQPLGEAEVDKILAQLELPAAKGKGILAKILGK
ncbi:MAG: hypothetical protein ACR2IF_06995 [Terriglobales bacterium]